MLNMALKEVNDFETEAGDGSKHYLPLPPTPVLLPPLPPHPVVDPEFPVGGCGPRSRGAWTPKAVTFRKLCMSKWKNLDPWGGAVHRASANVDPPMPPCKHTTRPVQQK